VNVVTTWVQARSRQISTSAPSVSSASAQRNVGRCEVAVAVESGAICRGAIGIGGVAVSGALASAIAPASPVGASDSSPVRLPHAHSASAPADAIHPTIRSMPLRTMAA